MTVTTIGFKEFEQKLRNAPKKLMDRVSVEVQAAALEWAEKVIASAPADQGFLRIGVAAVKLSEATWEVISMAAHSAYMEWGTGVYVSVPAEYASYAQEFKGKTGGTFQQLLEAITGWVKRKGIATGKEVSHIAFAIALKIVKVGVRPHPFFFIHKAIVEQKFIERLKNINLN